MCDRTGKGSRGVVDAARGQVAQHLITAVAVYEDDTVETLTDKRMRNVVAEVDKDVFPHSNGAWEPHVVFVETVMDHGRGQNLTAGAARGLLCDVLDQNVVDVDRQVIAMLLNGSDGNHNHGALPGPLASFRPGKCAVQMLGQVARSFRVSSNRITVLSERPAAVSRKRGWRPGGLQESDRMRRFLRKWERD